MIEQTKKKCSKCDVSKPIPEFPARGCCCKECKRAYNRKYYKERKEQAGIYAKQYREGHKEQIRVLNKGYYKKHEEERLAYARSRREKRRIHLLKKNYGLQSETYDEMLKTQGGVCKICGKAPNHKRLVVDHDHSRGIIRGLLCNRCNQAIGLMHDDSQIFENATDYLREFENIKKDAMC